MERIEKTLLLPLLAAAVLSSASCSDDKEKEPPVRAVNYTIEFSTVSQAVYLGDKYQTGEGNYRLTLTNADGDVLEADLTSVKAPKPSAAMPEAGVYTAAETRRAGTFAPEASSWETVKSGVEVRSANQAGQKTKFAIRAGSMTLAPAASGDGTFTLSGEVTDGDKTALSFSWSGALALTAFAACSNDDNENGGDGKETDPDYLALPHAYGTYYHTYWGDAAGDYYLVLTDADLDQADAAPYKYRLDIDFLSVLATDPKSARPLDGEYTIGKSTDNKAGVFIEGFLGTDSFGMPALFGTYWNEPDEEEGSTTPHAIVGGKMRIKTDNGITTIKAEFIDEDDSTLRVSYRGALEFENRINDSYRGDSKLNADYAMNADAPVVSIKKITDECTARYDRWDLHFYEKECYATQGATGYYLWFRLKTAPGQEYIPSGTYKATSDDTPGFLPGTREELGGGNLRAVNTWFYSGRTPHAPMTNGSLTLKTSNGTDYEVSFSTGDDHPMPYLVTGSFSGTVKKLASN